CRMPCAAFGTLAALTAPWDARRAQVPWLVVLVQSLDLTVDPRAVLADPTGALAASVHAKVMERHEATLRPGAVLVLRNAAIFHPAVGAYYLNVVLANVHLVLPPSS